MRCSKCGVEVARATPGKLPLCPKCDAELRPVARDDPPEEPRRKESVFQVVGSEIGQYKSQFGWLAIGVAIFCMALLVLSCCTCAFLLPTDWS
jgi:hypothetical protein